MWRQFHVVGFELPAVKAVSVSCRTVDRTTESGHQSTIRSELVEWNLFLPLGEPLVYDRPGKETTSQLKGD